MRRPSARRLGVLVVAFLAVAASGVLGQAPPLPPGGAAESDDLVFLAREWHTTEHETLVYDLIGRSEASGAGEIAFRMHGDIAALEGTYVREPEALGAAPVFNVGTRVDTIRFVPPLHLADGARLERILPPALGWQEGTDNAPQDGRLVFTAAVPHPGNGTQSPADSSVDRTTGLQLDLRLRVDGTPRDERENAAGSPAIADLSFDVSVPPATLSPEGRQALNDTYVTFVLMFDFGGSTPGRASRGPDPANATGVYLFRSDAAASLRIHTADPAAVTIGPDAGGSVVNETVRTIHAPVPVNVTAALRWTEENVSRARLDAGLGFHREIPENVPNPSDTRPAERDTPDIPVPWLVLMLVVVALARPRTFALPDHTRLIRRPPLQR